MMVYYFLILLFLSCQNIHSISLTGSLQGKITYSDNQIPVNVSIQILRNNIIEYIGYTDTSGNFNFPISTGTYDIIIYSTGYQTKVMYLIDISSGTKDLENIVLGKLSNNEIFLSNNILDFKEQNFIKILCQIYTPTKLQISVLTYTGELIKILANSYKQQGTYWIYWYGDNEENQKVGSGTYFINIKTDNKNQLKKVVVIK